MLHAVARFLPERKLPSAYCFRHTAVSDLLANEVDVTYLAKLHGHESLRTTQRYLRLDIGDLKGMHSRYHPREQALRSKTTVVPAANGHGATGPDAGLTRE